MSSDGWRPERDVGGILSDDPEENAHFADVNHVYVPYCSSDTWAGSRAAAGRGPSFMGRAIVREVIRELVDFEQLLSADELILAGSSAGATGVLINLDEVADALRPAGLLVRGLVDSGWFLDSGDERDECALDASSSRCSVISTLKQGIRMWDARVPEACRQVYPDQPWKCFFGYRLYPLIKSKINLHAKRPLL